MNKYLKIAAIAVFVVLAAGFVTTVATRPAMAECETAVLPDEWCDGNNDIMDVVKFVVGMLAGGVTFIGIVGIVICGVMYRYADGCMPTHIIPVNEILKEACASIGIPFVDLFEEMGVNNTNRTTFLYDGTHPNANGKERYVECLRKHIY